MGYNQEKKKEWTDAVREKYLSEEEAFSPAGWETVRRRVHRTEVVRRSIIAAAAVLLPFAALLLWSPWHNTVPAQESIIANTEETPVVPEASETTFDVVDPQSVATVPDEAPAVRKAKKAEQPGLIPQPEQTPIAEDMSHDQQQTPTPSADTKTTNPDSTTHSTPAPSGQPAPRRIQELVPDDLLAFAEPEPRQRRKISVGVSAGAGAIQRNMILNTMSAPYYTKLAYMNLGVRYETDVKISAANINRQYYNDLLTKTASNSYLANAFVPSDVEYRHDLPLSFGLLAKIGLLPWLGVESGVEYTYLHSVADSYLGTQEQRLHFIGIPVRMDAIIWSNRLLEVYAALGGKAEKCVSASLGRIKCDEPRLQWSAELAGGIQYHLWDRVNLYLQPELEWYLTQTDLITYRTEHPLGFALHAGLRFDL
ncbi:MAG: hypothetical protein K6G53_05295 [Bacteroidales bacterium]|nr:hypothetical protein [Bacteroidales bacterium]